ncbi:UDP-4-amino-4,6-dideoxy-N-acetyl-beta-L-altrosamine transaminase [Solidesulfovibrio magneticus]|uniref:DegT/DnrJ/EryC1/StrS aminotransferase family protein n=1 Tax=Solidesulfovibrio magneticus (strain ATCC 700980 / DSM 13731 / RS-1) TaxID=573370 RepID=C4XP18_SOLM1|nr:UDP-4-amino-4,6-dideoxy-N-acetyl-beta-L-altrosamine transaminase [Solidesulfovibrio magneticus]BAH77519.1 DegT/DnrJ/EryC1/StrS aminotransferase family protein [Solidesulfovibrio magneticus RS-1]
MSRPQPDDHGASASLPYGRQEIDETDIAAVEAVLGSGWLTTGPAVARFEAAVARFTGAARAVAVNSGTAALHVAAAALGLGPGDEAVTSPLTFAATANCVVYCGAVPVFADVLPESLLLDPAAAERAITPRTKAIIAVDYAGQPCDWDALRRLADRHGLALVADACHALGGRYKGRDVGRLADVTALSFHPVKHITTGEGGMALTDDPDLDRRMRALRNHGIDQDFRQREQAGSWRYAMTMLGFNYRLSDMACALGESQLARLPGWLETRRELAGLYDRLLAGTPARPLETAADREHARHLYVVRVPRRDAVFRAMRAQGIGVNVHYLPVHLHPYYRERFGLGPGLCPVAEAAAEEILTLPLFPAMTPDDVRRVADALARALASRD